LESWRQSLDWVGRLSPPHVSVYMLEVDEDSRLGKEVLFNGKRYGAPEVPSDALIVEMYEAALRSLHEIGVARYEISNFARPGFESLHNLKYWKLQPYIGFGSDAHSYDCGVRYQNVESAGEYVARWEKGESPRAGCVEANPVEEKFFVGLRLSQGVRPDSAEWRLYGDVIDRFIGDGLLEHDNGAVRLTERGVLVSNEVFQEFIHCG
jgi:oxygen-independent coproporphyrinogen-3 oxidase